MLIAARAVLNGAVVVSFDVSASFAVPPAYVSGILTDPKRLTLLDPRIRAITQLQGPKLPQPGSMIEVEVEIAFTLSVVSRLVGRPVALVIVDEWIADRRLICQVRGRHLAGRLDLELPAQNVLRVRGTIEPTGRAAKLAVAPIVGLLEDRARRAVERTIRRVEDTLMSSVSDDGPPV